LEWGLGGASHIIAVRTLIALAVLDVRFAGPDFADGNSQWLCLPFETAPPATHMDRLNDETIIGAVRRDYLIAKALAYCVAAMERLPFYQRELSDQKDMQTLFDTIIIPEADREQLRREARERFPPDG
jgi:hypothetical protein